jgi:hypothetical protein
MLQIRRTLVNEPFRSRDILNPSRAREPVHCTVKFRSSAQRLTETVAQRGPKPVLITNVRFAPEAVIRRSNVIEYSLAARQLMAQQHRAILYQLPAR